MPGHEPALVCNGLEARRAGLERDFQCGGVLVPADLIDEETAELEVLKEWLAAGAVEWHGG
jgi:hypothetical protein